MRFVEFWSEKVLKYSRPLPNFTWLSIIPFTVGFMTHLSQACSMYGGGRSMMDTRQKLSWPRIDLVVMWWIFESGNMQR